MSGVPGLKTLRSKSVLGLSSVVLIFGTGADRMAARQLVQERLTRVAADAARRGASAGDPVAALVAQPGDEDRRVVEDVVADRADDAGALDDPAAADGDSRRRQRRDLGAARSPAPGARRSRPAARQRRLAAGRDRRRRATPRRSRPAASSRHPTSAWRSRTRRRSRPRRTWRACRSRRRRLRPARLRGHRGRRRRTRGLGAPHRRRRRRRRGLPAADRRRRHQRRAGPAADRREAAGRQHAAGDPRRRDRAGGARDRPWPASPSIPPSSGRRRSSRCRSPISIARC